MRKPLIILLASILMSGSAISAGVPGSISYQGRLTDNVGDPVADGAYLVNFVIYGSDAGFDTLWSSGFQNVSTVGGLFSYDLGSMTPLPDDLFTDTVRYLGITVGVDPEISPRTRLETAPYAYHALRADTAAVATSSTGISYAFDPGDVVVTGFLNLLVQDSLNCPADGYVLVNVTTSMNCNHTAGDDDVVFLIITDSTTTVESDQDGHVWAVPPGPASGLYSVLMHTQKVYQVSAGWNKFEGLAFQNPGGGTDNFVTQDPAMSLLFIPQAFGEVSAGVSPPSPKFDGVPVRE